MPGSTKVDLNGLTEGTHPLVLHGGDAEIFVEENVSFRDFHFDGALSYVHEDCQVRGSLTGKMVANCDRCLASFDQERSAEFEAQVLLSGVAGDEEVTEGVIRLASESGTLDLADAFRAAVILDEPIKSLCRDGCRGLCPVCGVNRNESKCDCDVARKDLRWDALKDLSFEPPKE